MVGRLLGGVPSPSFHGAKGNNVLKDLHKHPAVSFMLNRLIIAGLGVLSGFAFASFPLHMAALCGQVA